MRKDSLVSFKSHKIVTTITLSPMHHTHAPPQSHRSKRRKSRKRSEHKDKAERASTKRRRKKQHAKGRKLLNITIHGTPSTNQSVTFSPIPMHSIHFSAEISMNKTYVLYREGFYEGDDEALIPINTITTGSMIEMDIEGRSNILFNQFQLNHIISRTPQKYHFMKWKCLYSLLNDGCSMQTFYGNTENHEQCMLVIQDQSNNIFGAFLDSKFRAQYHHYTGSQDCFVYKFVFESNEYSVFEYHPTGAKPYFLQSDFDGITVGAGECPAIYIERNLLMGRTTKSDTFQSELLSTNSIFEIRNIEVWCPFFE